MQQQPITPRVIATALTLLFTNLSYAVEPGETCWGYADLTALSSTCGKDGCDASTETIDNCPQDCQTGNAKLTLPYYALGENVCKNVQQVYTPNTIADVQTAVNESVAAGRTVKMVGSRHSTSNTICNTGNIILAKNLRTIEGISTIQDGPYFVEVVRFQAGVTFGIDDAKVDPVTLQPYQGLLDYLHAYGKTLNYAATGFSGITIAGAMATGVHGSNAQGPANIANEIQELWVVGANGSLNYYSKGTTGQTDSEKWKALTTNLGLLGPVVKIGMQIRNEFKLHTKIFYHTEAQLLATNGLANIVAGCSFSFMSWFPGSGTGSLTNTCGWETSEPVSQENTKMALFTPDIAPEFQGVFISESQRGSCPNMDIFRNVTYPLNYQVQRDFEVTRANFNNDPANAWIWLNGTGSQKAIEGVGYAYNMINIDLPNNQIAFSQVDWEVAVPFSQAQGVLNLINDVVGQSGTGEYNRALPTVGVVIRFDRATSNTIMSGVAAVGGKVDGDPMVHIEMPIFIPFKLRGTDLDNYWAPWNDLMTQIITNYDARPHWGKNKDWVFQNAAVKARNAPERARFQAVINQMDPNGVFSNKWAYDAGFTWPNGPSCYADVNGCVNSGNWVMLRHKATQRCMSSVSNLTDQVCSSTDLNQRWQLYGSGNIYQLRNVGTGQCAKLNSTSAPTDAIMGTCDSSNIQKFKFEDGSGDHYEMRSNESSANACLYAPLWTAFGTNVTASGGNCGMSTDIKWGVYPLGNFAAAPMEFTP